jgi:hypothetical protein
VEFLEALGAVAALQQEGLAGRDVAKQAFRRRASPANTSGGIRRRVVSTCDSAARSG